MTKFLEACSKSFCLTVVTDGLELMVNLPSNMTSMRIQPSSDSRLVEQMLDASDKACSDYIVQMHDPAKFMVAFDKVTHLADVRRSDKKLIFLPLDGGFNTTALIDNILSLKETSYVANILLITPDMQSSSECEVYDMITHKFVGPAEQIQTPLYLDRWDSCTGLFERRANLFPHDMTNLHGKTVKVTAFTYEPYTLLDLDTSLTPIGRDGIDIKLVEEFCRWINCTVEMVEDDGNMWGEIYENHTGVGILGKLVEDRADFSGTSAYSWYEEFKVLDFTAPIIRSAVTCLTPAPRELTVPTTVDVSRNQYISGKDLATLTEPLVRDSKYFERYLMIQSSWDLPLVPFSWLMWMCLMITFLFASIALCIAQRSTNNVFFSTFGTMIGQIPEDHGTWRIRAITGWMLVTGLVIDNAYSGGLAASFTVPKYEKSIDTVQDLMDINMEWGASHESWAYSLILSEEPVTKRLISQFRTYSTETLKQKSFQRNMAFSIERLPGGSFALGEHITRETAKNLQLMSEDMYYEQCVIMARKSSPYTAKLTQLIGRLHQSGLLICWETQVSLNYLDNKLQLEVRLSRAKKELEVVEPLNMKQILGIYIFYFVGLVMSLLAFIWELLTHRGKALIML